MSGKIPYGYRIENGEPVVVPEEAERLRTLFRAYLEGRPVGRARELAGIPRSESCCGRMLRNRLYLGDGCYPPLLTEDLLDRAEEERARRRAAAPARSWPGPRKALPAAVRFRWAESGEVPPSGPAEYAAWVFGCIRAEKENEKEEP